MEKFLTKDLEKYDKMYTYFINPNQVELESDKGHLHDRIEFRTINTVNDVQYECEFTILFSFDNGGDPVIEVTITWYDKWIYNDSETFELDLNQFRKFIDYDNKLKISKVWSYVRNAERNRTLGYFD